MPGTYPAGLLKNFCINVLQSLNLSGNDAMTIADSLIQAELEGVKSHGLSRLATYVNCLRTGQIRTHPHIRIEQTGCLLKVDGNNGMGQVISMKALEEAIPVAKTHGMAGIFIQNSNHFGSAAYYCQRVFKEQMALIATTNSPSGIPPWGGKKAFFGTNPIAFGFPAKDEPPIIVDMSSSVAARGKIMVAKKNGEEIPPDWAIDEEGEPTQDPTAALKGALLPIGGAKGYALALAVEVMSAILSGAAFGPHVGNLNIEGDPPANVGHTFILLDLKKLIDMDQYYARIKQFIKEVKSVPRIDPTKEIRYPGERRARILQEQEVNGIILSDEVGEELKMVGQTANIPFPFPNEIRVRNGS